MSQVTASLVKELREKTGVGMMDCKTALKENNADIEASIDWLRTKGIAKAAKKEGRIASEGLIAVEKIDNIASIIEVPWEKVQREKKLGFWAMNGDEFTLPYSRSDAFQDAWHGNRMQSTTIVAGCVYPKTCIRVVSEILDTWKLNETLGFIRNIRE